MFKSEKVAQIAAYLLIKEGRPAPYMKLLKLMYLADRLYLSRYGDTISGDWHVSMPHGPVLSCAYDRMKGAVIDSCWSQWIDRRGQYDLAPTNNALQGELLELQGVEVDTLDEIYGAFGAMDQWQLRDWTHAHCKEWRDPGSSSYPIAPIDIFKALGADEGQAEMRAAQYNETRALDAALNRYR